MALGISQLGAMDGPSATLAPILKVWAFEGLPRFFLGDKVALVFKGFGTSEPTAPTLSPATSSSAILSTQKITYHTIIFVLQVPCAKKN